MANLSKLVITDVADLRNEANNFQTHADEVKAKTDAMLDLVEQTSGVWRGEAQSKYSTQFSGLSDDMQRIYNQCTEYSTDLLQIADNYEATEGINIETGARLKTEIEMH